VTIKSRVAGRKPSASTTGKPSPKAAARPAVKVAAKPAPPPPPTKRPAHRPPYQANEDDRGKVWVMTAGGIGQDQICTVLCITGKTLRKCYRKELDTALTLAIGQIAQSLFRKAKNGDVNAIKFYLANRAPKQWSEKIILVDKDAEVDPKSLSDAEIADRIAKLSRIPAVARARKKAANGS
jgi:hypothetical protein